MRNRCFRLLGVSFGLGMFILSAQPPTGIVATRQGEIYFADSGAGVWKRDPNGRLTLLESTAMQSLALDVEGSFTEASLDPIQRVTAKGAAPALLAGDETPVTVSDDGHLFYATSANGQVEIVRLRPNGERFVVASLPVNPKDRKLRAVNGIAAGPGNAIYLTGNHAIRRVTPRGEVTTIAGPLNPAGCEAIPAIKKDWRPYLTGIAVDTNGTAYVAATGCGTVLKVTPDGKVSTIHKTQPPWTPTGIAISRGDLYVLEYSYAASKNPSDWTPRVVKLTAVSVSVVATVTR